MKLRAFLLLLALPLAACVVGPPPGPYLSMTPVPAAVPGPDDFVPPPDYVVDAPLYYPQMPGVAFYPIFIDVPGSCHCVLPMRYDGGAWVGVDGRVLHRGHFPYRRPEPVHLERWRANPGVVNGWRPVNAPPPRPHPPEGRPGMPVAPTPAAVVRPPGPPVVQPAPPAGRPPATPTVPAVSGATHTPSAPSTPVSRPPSPPSRPSGCTPRDSADRKC